MLARLAVSRLPGSVLLLVLAAACGPGAPSATPAPSAGPPGTTSPAATLATAGSPQSAAPPSAPASTAAIPGSGGPPQAMLRGVAAGNVAGDQGTFSWDGLVSDAPWVVGAAGGTATRGESLKVAFAPGVQQTEWQARWATLAAGAPGTPEDGGSGDGGAIELQAPDPAGSWSLQLEAWFGDGRRATWYWRVEVSP